MKDLVNNPAALNRDRAALLSTVGVGCLDGVPNHD